MNVWLKNRIAVLLVGFAMSIYIAGTAVAAPPPTCDVCPGAPIECPYASIQAAIRAASDGDTIWVCSGTYHENIDFLGKAITVRSMGGAETTVIDADLSGSVVTFVSGEGPDSVLHDLTLTRGRGTYVESEGNYGAGIFCDSSSPTVTDCTLYDNQIRGGGDGGGGGVYCNSASPTFTDCVFHRNRSDWDGGGAYCRASDPTFTRCTFLGNLSSYKGAGIYSDPDSTLTLTDCDFESNYMVGGPVAGGGIYFDASPPPTLVGCTFITNRIASGNGSGIYFNNMLSATLTECTFNGNWNISGGDGGAIYFDNTLTATLTGCTFSENTVNGNGAGVYLTDSTATFTGCDFIENTASLGGGGMASYLSSPMLDGCTFEGNESESPLGGGGGAVYCGGFPSPVLDGCLVTGNEAGGVGGGISCEASSPTLTGCTISGNTASQYGGGLSCIESSGAMIIGCTISNNTAEMGGGGISTLESPVEMINCTVVGNRANGTFWDQGGGGAYCQSATPTITNCTFSDNYAVRNGGGIYSFSSSVEMVNSILWGDRAGSGLSEVYVSGGDDPVINYSDVQGGWAAGAGNIDVDPSFVGGGDYHLTVASLCIDAGDPAGVPPAFPADDMDGDARPQHAAYDMGADEYVGDLCVDADGDGYYGRLGCGTKVDCDDEFDTVHPGAPEICDGMDNDCDGVTDEGCYPTIRVATDGSEFTTGETMTASLQTTTGADPAVVDVYLCLYLPSGIFVFLPSLSTYPTPLLKSWTVVDWGPGVFFRWTFSETHMAGTYYWIALYTEPDTFDIVGVGDVAPFTFTP